METPGLCLEAACSICRIASRWTCRCNKPGGRFILLSRILLCEAAGGSGTRALATAAQGYPIGLLWMG